MALIFLLLFFFLGHSFIELYAFFCKIEEDVEILL